MKQQIYQRILKKIAVKRKLKLKIIEVDNEIKELKELIRTKKRGG